MAVKIFLCLTIATGWTPTIANGVGSYDGKTETTRSYEVTGTLSELDLASGKGMIRTDLGKPIYLEVRKPELFPNLSVGDRLTIQLNGDGEVDKLMGMSVPELGITGQAIPATINNDK
jgi:hypothetical protein